MPVVPYDNPPVVREYLGQFWVLESGFARVERLSKIDVIDSV